MVEFANPKSAIRGTAKPYDLGAKNIDVNCSDMPQKISELQSTGFKFRSDMAEYELDDIRAREIQMPAHDGLNVVLVEVLSKGFETPYTEAGFAATTSFVVIVDDIERETDFYRSIFGFDEIMRHQLSGPEIEKVIGLPPGSSLHMHLCGKANNMFGRMELIHYEGLAGTDLFKAARAPATGILNCWFQVDSLARFTNRARDESIEINNAGSIDTMVATGEVALLQSPAGLRIQA